MNSATSRRTFLGATAALAAASRAGFSATTEDPREFKIGVATYSLRKFTRAQAIQMLKQLNVKYIDIKDVHLPLNSTPDEIKAARKEFEDAGFIIEGGGNVSFQKDDEQDIRNKFEYAKLAGLPLIVCAPTHATLPKMEKYVKEYNIKIALHNHGPEDKHFPTPQSVLDAVKDMDPRCGLCMDIGHSARTGVDIVESARQAGSRLLSMHTKDLADTTAKGSQCDVGDGVLPIVGLFRQLHKMNYTGGVMLEYEIHDTDPMPGMQKSLAYERGVAAALRG
ncbi:MAG TPA: sugar phosphate isomerase/epimerase [Bryobacteraceae bacterium]|nr:sugar phosphate isomerase/epimerase [Bryobacteraceae bacterium]